MADHRSSRCTTLKAHRGKLETPEYAAWVDMRQRCRNQKHQSYSRYGGRGISICERWETFEAFLEDMGSRPSLYHTLERIDNDGDYTPENCRWATRLEQANNTSRNILHTYNGRTLTQAQWEQKVALPRGRLGTRLRVGLTLEQALSKPLSKMYTYLGKTQTLTQWANEFRISPQLLRWRLQNGWTLEKVFLRGDTKGPGGRTTWKA